MFRDFGGLPGATILNASSHTLRFRTADIVPPVIIDHIPTQGRVGVSRYSPAFTFTWNEDVVVTHPTVAADESIVLYKKADGTKVSSATNLGCLLFNTSTVYPFQH